jgi:hypothetical protein
MPEFTFCANHPTIATGLRCNRCSTPICSKCAVRTPVGYRCRNCVRQQQQIFETALWYDYVLAAVVIAPLAAIAGFLLNFVGFFVVVLAPVAGGAIAEVARFVVRRRRGRYLGLLATVAFVVGCLPVMFGPFLLTLFEAIFLYRDLSYIVYAGMGHLLNLLWPIAYAVIGASTLYYRLRGISLG